LQLFYSASIKLKARISILSSNFSIFAYKTLRRQLEKAESIRLLFQKNSLNASSILGGEIERRFRNSLEQSRVAQDCKAWLDQKVDIKVTTMPTPQNLIIVQNEDGGSFAITGSSPFTSVGLGVLPSNGYEMNTLLQEEEELSSLLEWFEGFWNDPGVSSSDNSGLESELQEADRRTHKEVAESDQGRGAFQTPGGDEWKDKRVSGHPYRADREVVMNEPDSAGNIW
jgi:hypothetical protein